LETLFRTFEAKAATGYFPKLPDLVDTDLGLLTEEEEWELFFNHIVEFPNLIEKSIGDLENGRVSPHLICGFLSDLVATFSVYYRRVRILTVFLLC
jgi:arginyl-tRNA synthetase